MRLYNYWRSSSSYRVRIALHAKGLPFEYVPVNLLAGEQLAEAHRARNPIGSVPVLEVDDEGRTLRLSQSVAIFEYLEERWPERPLLPRARSDRAHARAMAELINSGIQPLHNLSVLKRVKEQLQGDGAEWAKHFVTAGLTALETMAKASAGKFLVGDALSWADCCLVPQLFGARRFGAPLESYPTLLRVESHCLELDAVKKSRPEAQIDAQPG